MSQRIFKGFLVGLIFNGLGILLCLLLFGLMNDRSVEQMWTAFVDTDRLWMLISLGALPNLLAFFEFLKRDQEYEARGVLLATIGTALMTYFLYFF
ncbi:MAG: hypothetical protein ACPG39_02220 [Flavobacteriaceae bacterium]|jgi:hypothetical protein